MELIKNSIAIKYKNNNSEEINERIIQDKTIKLEINNEFTSNFAVINDSLKEFAIGYLFGENLVKSLEDIENIDISKDKISISIKNNTYKSSKVESSLKVSPDELINNMNRLTDNAKIWQETGGTHVAAIVYKEL